MNQEKVLEVKDLHTWFSNKGNIIQAVNGVSFDVHRGEVLGLVGESGCGKSSTCRSIIGLVQSGGYNVKGEILYEGKNLLNLSEKEWNSIRGSQISMIFQEPMNALNPVTTIGEQMAEAMVKLNLTKKEIKMRSIELLKRVEISSPEMRLSFYPHQLSGGMRQRAMIAIALASKPRLLLADEPTTALDVTIQDQIIKLLLQLIHDLDMSLVLVTHDLGVASSMCDSIAVMYAGRIVEQASAHDLFYHPSHPYTYGLMRSLPLYKDKKTKLSPIKGVPPSLSSRIIGCPFAPRCEYVTDQCKKMYPPLQQPSPHHYSCCFHIDQLQDLPAILEYPV